MGGDERGRLISYINLNFFQLLPIMITYNSIPDHWFNRHTLNKHNLNTFFYKRLPKLINTFNVSPIELCNQMLYILSSCFQFSLSAISMQRENIELIRNVKHYICGGFYSLIFCYEHCFSFINLQCNKIVANNAIT